MELYLKPSEPEDEAFVRRLNKLAYEEVVVAQFGPWDPVKQKAFFDGRTLTHRSDDQRGVATLPSRLPGVTVSEVTKLEEASLMVAESAIDWTLANGC